MPSPTEAHRTEFTVRCTCGIEYHTSDTHIGKVLPCKCGRKVDIARPAGTENNARSRTNERSTRAAKEPETKRRRVTRKRRYVPGALGLRFGKTGAVIERANSATARWIAAQLHPMFAGSIFVRSTAIAAWAYLIVVVVAWLMLKFWSEQTLSATIIAYGPRFLALWPFALLVPAALLFQRRGLLPLAVALWLVVGPIMGYVINIGTIGAKMPLVPAPGTFRLLTFNAQGGNPLSYDLGVLLKDEAPDIFTFQECGDKLAEVIEGLKGWYSKRYGSLCTGSRWQIANVDLMPREDLARVSKFGFGGTGLVMRTFIDSPHGTLIVVNVHLETARHGLESMLSGGGVLPDDNPFNREKNALEGIETAEQNYGTNAERFRKNTIIRETESDRASRWATSGVTNTPLLIAGDFNLPVESTIFQRHWTRYVDAFETLGNGLGWTKREGRWLRIRIDHILSLKNGLQPRAVVVGPDYQSDHLPLIADYAWPVTKP